MRPRSTRRANAIVTDRLFAEVYYPGIMVTETSAREVKGMFPGKLAAKLDKRAFGFRYILKTFAKVSYESTKPILIKFKYLSGTYYIGKKLTLDEVKKLKPEKNYEILVRNMEINKWNEVVQCRPGNFQEFSKGDVVLPYKEEKAAT
jgi:hypothetical protein